MIPRLRSRGSSRGAEARPVAVLIACLLALASAAGAGDKDEAADRAHHLERQVVELRRELVMRDLEIERLAEELKSLRSRVAELESSRQPAQPVGSPETLDAPEPNVDLTDGIEEVELEEPPRSELPAAEPDTRLRDSMQEPSPGASTGPTRQPATATSPNGGEELYDRGYQLFHEERYPEAERAFRLFLTQHPASELADNALFWIGESRWSRGDFAAALESYTATVERYPGGNKVPDALLKAGRCLETLGQVGRAVRTYEEVVLRFAGSAAAISAEERLEALRGGSSGAL